MVVWPVNCARAGGRIVNPPLHPRLLETLVQDYWVPLVIFDPDWRVLVWNRGAQELFQLPVERAVGRPLEETGILPDRSYGVDLRRRVEARENVVLAGVPAPGNGRRRGALVHRFQRIAQGDPTLGFFCATAFQEEADRVPASLAEQAQRSHPAAGGMPIHDLRNSLQIISNHSELLLAEVAETSAAARVHEILREVEGVMRRVDEGRGVSQAALGGKSRSSHGEEV